MSIVEEEIKRLRKEYVSNLSREELVDFLLGNWDKSHTQLEAIVKDYLVSRTDLLPLEKMQSIANELLS
jgi:hypothetical protein